MTASSIHLFTCLFEAEDAAHRLQSCTTFLIGHFDVLFPSFSWREVTKHRRATSLNRGDDSRRIHRQHHMHGSHAAIRRWIRRKALPQGDRVREAESAAQVSLQTPPASREISPYSIAVFPMEELAEADDFPKSTP